MPMVNLGVRLFLVILGFLSKLIRIY